MEANYFTILYWFCHTLTWIRHGCTCVPHPEPPSHLPPHPIPLGHPSAAALSTLCYALNLDWQFVSQMIIYMFQCHSPKSSHPRPLPQSPKDCSIHLCFFLLSLVQGYHYHLSKFHIYALVYCIGVFLSTETCIISNKKWIASPGSIQDAWGWCTGMTRRDGTGREVGGGTRVHPWQIHVDVWQNQYNIVK